MASRGVQQNNMVEVIYINKAAIPDDVLQKALQEEISPRESIFVPPTPESSEQLCKKFKRWLDTAQVGDKFRYYLGHHVAGNSIGRIAQRAYEEGKVILYQKREGIMFGYYAQKVRIWRK